MAQVIENKGEMISKDQLKSILSTYFDEEDVEALEIADDTSTSTEELTTKEGIYKIRLSDIYSGTFKKDEEWEFAIGGDTGAPGLSVGDIIKPKNTNIANEEFYVIDTSSEATLTLLAKTLVKVTSGTGQYTQIGTTEEAGTLKFDSNNKNVYKNSDIKKIVKNYTDYLETYLTLEDVEIEEGGNAVNGVKGRLMWRNSGSNDSVSALLDAGLTDVVYGTAEGKLNYWLGSPHSIQSNCALYVDGERSYVAGYWVTYMDRCRSTPSNKNFKV